MKKIYLLSMLLACTLFVTSCSNDTEKPAVTTEDVDGLPVVKVNFSTDAQDILTADGTRAFSEPSYTNKANFRILAFRQSQDNNDYVYLRDIRLDNMTMDEATRKLSGYDYLPYGTYKFVPVYMDDIATSSVTWPIFTAMSTPLTDNLILSHQAFYSLPQVFTQGDIDSWADATPYDVNLDGTSDDVSLTLTRAVGRVDILFVKTDHNGNEVAMTSGQNVLGDFEISSFQLVFGNINTTMQLTGTVASDQTGTNHTFTMSDLDNNLVIGTSATGSRIEQSNNGLNYNLVQEADVLSGAAYFRGPYLFPKASDQVTLSMSITNNASQSILGDNSVATRPITITEPIPVKANTVTIVKVKTKSGHIFDSRADFVVEIETVWEDSETVDGGIVD